MRINMLFISGIVDDLKEFIIDKLINTLNGFDKTVARAQEVLRGTGTYAFDADYVWDQVVRLSGYLKPFCNIVIAICLLIELAQVAAKVDVIQWEHGLKICIKMVLAKVCIDIAPTFLRACYDQANVWISRMFDTPGRLGTLFRSEIRTAVEDVEGFGTALGLLVTTILVGLAVDVCGLIIQVIAYGRMFELFVYLAVSPLPCAFFPLGDGTGGGYSRITQKFFKSFIAVCLQGVMMIVSMRIFYIIIGSALGNMINNISGSASGVVSELCLTMLMAALTLVLAITRCGSWAKSIIDAM